jgi:hypothetical protein
VVREPIEGRAAIDPGLSEVLLRPFSLRPLVDNAVRRGLHSSPEAGLLRLVVRAAGPWLEMSVSDDGEAARQRKLNNDSSGKAMAFTLWRCCEGGGKPVRTRIPVGRAQRDRSRHHREYPHSLAQALVIGASAASFSSLK